MNARILDGKAVAATIQKEMAEEVFRLEAQHGLVPGFASVLVGNHPASQVYLRNKIQAAQEVGIHHFARDFPVGATTEEVVAAIQELNGNPEVHGIIAQLPLPKDLDEEIILNAVDLEKDVDGLHLQNFGRLAMKGRDPSFIPSTPKGILALLEHAGVQLDGARAVMVGRSNLVGLPLALLLLHRNATVTICHSHTPDLREFTKQADILVVAVGRPRTIRGDMVKPGAVVIDVGTNRIPDLSTRSGYRLVGDVAFEEVVEVASAITPMPGGVGPVTVAMLLQNILIAALQQWHKAGLLPQK